MMTLMLSFHEVPLLYESVRVKTKNLGFRSGQTLTGLYSHRLWLEAGNFGFRK